MRRRFDYPKSNVDRLIAIFGSQSEAARRLNMKNRATLWDWRRKGWIPLVWAADVEAVTGGQITIGEVIAEASLRQKRSTVLTRVGRG